jgi:hypothetical protein
MSKLARLTGRIGFRRGWRGKMVLRVQVERFVPEYPYGGEFRLQWEDATEDQANEVTAMLARDTAR